MKTHFEHLLETIPDLKNRYVLDLGSGRGRFLVDLAKNGVKATGLELNPAYVDAAIYLAKENNVSIHMVVGVGEKLPYLDSTFDFVNLCEVIEHVLDPKQVMLEVHRVLRDKGLVYVSVPNRFGMKDQHFNLYFVNWMPRRFSDRFISFFNKQKDYKADIGFQRLDEMHYYTFGGAKRLFIESGFHVQDIRLIKISKRFPNKLISFPVSIVYKISRFFYFDSFHFLLEKV